MSLEECVKWEILLQLFLGEKNQPATTSIVEKVFLFMGHLQVTYCL